MPKIHWIGIIEENKIREYQRGSLDSKAIKIKMPKNMNELMIKGLPFLIPAFIIMFVSMNIKTVINQQNIVNRPFILVGAIIGFILLLVHEYLHSIVYPKEANSYIGIAKPITFVSLTSYPLSKRRFIVMSLLPYILGIIPLILFWLCPASLTELNGIFFGMACMGMASPYPDSYTVYQIIKQVPENKKIQNYEDDIYYI
ncbi:MAG: DUF3267 domain-containing protein [Clostridia bacterium]|jgi:hypothetical protein|nr:DUF3267 domain-containing protein [Clostridia bacterium]